MYSIFFYFSSFPQLLRSVLPYHHETCKQTITSHDIFPIDLYSRSSVEVLFPFSILRPDPEQERMLESIKARMGTLVFDGTVRMSMILNMITSYDIIVNIDAQIHGEGHRHCVQTRQWNNWRGLQN